MTLLGASDITKAYGERTLLDRISLTIEEGERIGVIGRNGAGKSTLARILAGLETPDVGSISVKRGARVMYLEQEPYVDPQKTARKVAEEGLGAWTEAKERHDLATKALESGEGDLEKHLDAQLRAAQEVERLGGWERSHLIERVLSHLGIENPDQLAGTMSGGQQRRVAIARLLAYAPDLMILDEPTNHLDASSIDWLERFLVDEYKGGVVMVTHDRYLLDSVVDRTLEVENGGVYSYEGGYESFLYRKAERLEHEERTEKNRQNFLRKELEWLSRQPKARSTKQKARIRRAETARDDVPQGRIGQVELSASAGETGKTVLEIRKLDLAIGGQTLIKNLDLTVMSGERLGVLGPNGCGKSTLLRAITGELPPARGEIIVGKRVRLGYLDQKREELDENASVYETVADAVPLAADGKERIDPRSYLERFLFDPQAQRKKVAALSGGERARLSLARLLASSANLLLLDEPSNDLDIDTLSALEDFLTSWEGSVIVVTHDRYLLDRVTTGILSFEGDGKVVRYAGAYQAFASTKERELETKRLEKAAAAKPASLPPKKTEKSGISKNEQRVLDELPQKIDEAEKVVAAIEVELSDPALYVLAADDRKAKEIRDRLEKAKAESARLMEKWEDLESRR